MNSDLAIKVENLTKVYKLYDTPQDRLKESLHPLRKKYHHDFHALNDVSFRIKKGEAVGIVGKNGSGKSTLLKLITGVITPSTGTVVVNGRVSALLELGAGFNPELTGLENVYFNGTLMGYSKGEMDEKLDSILTFADIGQFVQHPVKTYSSGMFVRLAFAVAVSIEPEILIVDEALSVGDAYFQAKCYERINQFKRDGMTFILVTHSVGDIVKHCNRAFFVKNGRLVLDGEPKDVTNHYLDELFGKQKDDKPNNGDLIGLEQNWFSQGELDVFHTRPGYRKEEHRWGKGGARILDFIVRSAGIDYPPVIESKALTEICFNVIFEGTFQNIVPGILIKTHDGIFLYGTNSYLASRGKQIISVSVGQVVGFVFSLPFNLNEGHYLISLGVSTGDSQESLEPLDRRYDSILVSVSRPLALWGIVDLNADFKMLTGAANE